MFAHLYRQFEGKWNWWSIKSNLWSWSTIIQMLVFHGHQRSPIRSAMKLYCQNCHLPVHKGCIQRCIISMDKKTRSVISALKVLWKHFWGEDVTIFLSFFFYYSASIIKTVQTPLVQSENVYCMYYIWNVFKRQ
jgi:hypothetical protein